MAEIQQSNPEWIQVPGTILIKFLNDEASITAAEILHCLEQRDDSGHHLLDRSRRWTLNDLDGKEVVFSHERGSDWPAGDIKNWPDSKIGLPGADAIDGTELMDAAPLLDQRTPKELTSIFLRLVSHRSPLDEYQAVTSLNVMKDRQRVLEELFGDVLPVVEFFIAGIRKKIADYLHIHVKSLTISEQGKITPDASKNAWSPVARRPELALKTVPFLSHDFSYDRFPDKFPKHPCLADEKVFTSANGMRLTVGPNLGGHLTLGECLSKGHEKRRLVKHLVDAMTACRELHRIGIIHHDIKPGNILSVNDVGILGDLESCFYLGEPNLHGTPCYDPTHYYRRLNAIRNKRSGGTGEFTNPAFDVFGFGVSLVELFTKDISGFHKGWLRAERKSRDSPFRIEFTINWLCKDMEFLEQFGRLVDEYNPEKIKEKLLEPFSSRWKYPILTLGQYENFFLQKFSRGENEYRRYVDNIHLEQLIHEELFSARYNELSYQCEEPDCLDFLRNFVSVPAIPENVQKLIVLMMLPDQEKRPSLDHVMQILCESYGIDLVKEEFHGREILRVRV